VVLIARTMPPAGHLAGVKSTFKGQVLGEEYTVWPSQLDFSAELTKARNSKGIDLRFYPGAAASVPQPICAGPASKRRSRSYTAFTIDELSLPLQKDKRARRSRRAGVGQRSANDQNKKSSTITARSTPACVPTFYGAQSMMPRSWSIARWLR